ncbi:MAG: hypothetical protein HYY85_12125, partial [Deltaproteobacteria bacterium]|nr:hypothetical protein [Deltaproteobacteria bacterium]
MKRSRGGATGRALAAVVLLVAVLAQAGAGLGQGIQVVALFPLATYSREPIQPVADRVAEGLSARLARFHRLVFLDPTRVRQAVQAHRGELSHDAIRAINQQLGADVALVGSLTRLGETYSLDLRVVPTRGQQVLTAFLQGRGVEGLLGQIEPLTQVLNQRLAAAGTGSPPPSTGVVVSLPPGLRQGPEPDAASGGAAAVVPRPIFPRPSASTIPPTRSWRVCGDDAAEVLAIGAGNVTGTQAGAVVLLGARGVGLYRLEDDGVRRIGQFPAAPPEQFLSLDVADLNRNGRDELYVTASRNGRMESAVLEWDGQALRRITGALPWALRVATLPKTGPILLGQAEPGSGEIYRLMWQEDRLVPDLPLSLPVVADVQSLAFGTSGPRGSAQALFLDVEGH